jgi:hypothetical protein
VDIKGAHIPRLREFLASVADAWTEATSEQRNRLAKALYAEVWINQKTVVSVRPRPEFEPFFLLDCQEKGGTGGPEGIRTPDLCLDRAAC